MSRIGWLGHTTTPLSKGLLASFVSGLRELGYVEGGNYVIEYRWGEGNNARLAQLAAELVRLKPDLIVAQGTPQAFAAKRATPAIPIVVAAAGDPVATGLVSSLGRPGGNLTGSAILSSELMLKRFELLMEALPRVRQLAVLINPTNPVQRLSVKAMEDAARRQNVNPRQFEARSLAECEAALAAMAHQHLDAMVITQDGLFIEQSLAIAALTAKHSLPSAGFGEFAEAGGMLGYGVNIAHVFRRAAYFVDRILNGAKPAQLPVEQASRFEMIVNLKTAAALGITLPRALLLRADKMIE